MYEAALQVACWKVVETAAALQSDLDRLDNKLRGRLWARSQSGSRHRTQSGGWHRTQSRRQHRVRSGSWHRAYSQGRSEDRVGAQTPNHCPVDPQNEQAHSQDHIWEPPNKKVSFQMPKDEDSGTESRDTSAKLPIKDLGVMARISGRSIGHPHLVGRIEGHSWHEVLPTLWPAWECQSPHD